MYIFTDKNIAKYIIIHIIPIWTFKEQKIILNKTINLGIL